MKGPERAMASPADFPGISSLKQKMFLQAYSVIGSINGACRIAKMTRRTYNNWMVAESQAGDKFRESFKDAQANLLDSCEQEAIHRGKEGDIEAVYQGGVRVGYRVRKSDKCLLHMMGVLDPERHATQRVSQTIKDHRTEADPFDELSPKQLRQRAKKVADDLEAIANGGANNPEETKGA